MNQNSNVNPKSLKGNEAFQHALDLMNKLTPINESTPNASLEFIKRGPNNLTYTIIRENRKYFIKTTKNTSFKITELEYVGGLQNKMQESYNSYEDALKHLNMKFHDLNETYKIKKQINLFEQDHFDIEEELDGGMDRKKYKLRLPNSGGGEPSAPAPEPSPAPIPSDNAPSVDGVESPEIEDVPSDDAGYDDSGEDASSDIEDEDDEEDPVKYIQRLTGKLGQKIRELDQMDPKLEKYVINSIISALHIDKMDKKDRIDIIKKFKKRRGMESDMGLSSDQSSKMPVDNSGGEQDMGESFNESDMDEKYGMMSMKGPFNYESLASSIKDNDRTSMKFKKMDIGMDEESEITDEDFLRHQEIAKELSRARHHKRHGDRFKNMDIQFHKHNDIDMNTEVKPDIKTPPAPHKPKRSSPFQPPRPNTTPGPKANRDELEEKFKSFSSTYKKKDIGSNHDFDLR